MISPLNDAERQVTGAPVARDNSPNVFSLPGLEALTVVFLLRDEKYKVRLTGHIFSYSPMSLLIPLLRLSLRGRRQFISINSPRRRNRSRDSVVNMRGSDGG